MVISLFLAVGLWLYVSMNGEYTTTLELPFSVILPENRAVENALPLSVQTNVRGTGWQLFNASYSSSPRCAVVIPYKFLEQEQTVFKLNKTTLLQSVQLPADISASDMLLDSLSLQIGVISQKKVPIRAVLSVTTRDGFMLTSVPKIEPDSIVIRGNKKALEHIEFWNTEPILVSDAFKPLNRVVRLSDSLSNIIFRLQKDVAISIDIQQTAEITYQNIPIEFLSKPTVNGAVVQPMSVAVTMRGGINAINNLSASDIKVAIDFGDSGRNSGGFLPFRVSAPAGILILSVSPPRAQVIHRVFAKKL